MKSNIKKLIAGSMTLALCMLSGCTGNPDNREDPLSGYDVNAILPFPTRQPVVSATQTPEPQPENTSIVNIPQDWQNESAPGSDKSTDAPTRKPSPTATRNSYTFSRLEQGDVSDEVLRLQNRLIELGYLGGTADGKFGANTKTAVKLFQKTLGLSQTGVATVSLQEKLFMASAPVYVPTVAITNPPSSQTVYQALVRGDRSLDVQKLQNRLIELGYLTGTADGVFGANTENAVKAFQAQLGLSQTGVASASMQNYLYSSTAPYAPVQATARPTQRPTATPSADFGYTQLEPGDSGEEVVRMQNRLKQLGYFTGSVTGNYYKETTAAVQKFQAELGLSQTGIASASLLTKLYASSAPAYSGEDAATAEPSGGYTTLRTGSKGTEVRNLQKRLIELGYMTTTADGDYGTRTANAVRLFQKAVGYEQNGVASVGLQNLLFSANAPVYIPTTTEVPAPVRTPTPTAVPSAGYQQLEPGDTGESVKRIQTRLKELGFFSGLIGGNYLTKTTDAVRLFQAAIGHAETGVCTPEMQEILFSDDAPHYSSVESDYVNLEKNDSGIQVLYLQQRLKELGYLSGSADGDYGSKTETAVKSFQNQAGLPVTGKATAETQEVLFSSNAPYAPLPTNAPTQAPTKAPTVPPQQSEGEYRELHYKNSGEDVKNLQRRLKELGYYEGELGGNYLTITQTAVKLFQASLGYEADGIATPSLQSLLFSESAPYYDGSGYIPLTNGDSGPAVKNLQRRLIELGYLSGSADGDFGGGTERAIERFQDAIGYSENGIASVELQMILFSSAAPGYSPAETAVPPVSTNPPVVEDDSPRDLSYGDTGLQVRELQLRLRELGYLSGSADGDFGKGTQNAVKLFQQTINYYTTDGVATIELQSMIFSSDAPEYVEEEPDTPDMPDVESDYRTLQHGNSGEDVKAIQRRLKELGYFSGDIGGNYLTKTETAVKLFQKAIGYPQDGVATPVIQEAIFSSAAPHYSDSSKPSVSVSPDKPDHLEVLSYGDSGSLVRTLQQRLIYLGWLTGDADGDFGEATETALNAFLYRMGLIVDGTASIEAQELLYADTAPAYVEYFELLPGDEGAEVLAMQMRLIELGYLELNEYNTDGIYGAGLQNALIQLELASGVEPELAHGLATIELQTFLFSENAMLYAILPDLF